MRALYTSVINIALVLLNEKRNFLICSRQCSTY